MGKYILLLTNLVLLLFLEMNAFVAMSVPLSPTEQQMKSATNHAQEIKKRYVGESGE